MAQPILLTNIDSTHNKTLWVIDAASPVDSGYVAGTNIFNDGVKATKLSLPAGMAGAQVTGVDVWFAARGAETAEQSYRIEIYDGDASGPGVLLHSQPHDVEETSISPELENTVATIHDFDVQVAVGPVFFAAVNFGDYLSESVDMLAIATSQPLGVRVEESWEQWADGSWNNISDAWLEGAEGRQLWIAANIEPLATAIEGEIVSIGGLRLHHNYPNPFRTVTAIRFTLPDPSEVSIYLTDFLGRTLLALAPARYPAGENELVLDGSSLARGAYICTLSANGQHVSRPIFVVH